jgi:hypothetical protein
MATYKVSKTSFRTGRGLDGLYKDKERVIFFKSYICPKQLSKWNIGTLLTLFLKKQRKNLFLENKNMDSHMYTFTCIIGNDQHGFRGKFF